PEMAPETLRVVRVEPHGLLDPLDPLLRPAEPGQDFAVLDDDQVIIGIEGERPLLMVESLVVVVADDVHRREDAMDIGIVLVERQRRLKPADHVVPGRLLVFAPALNPALAEDAGSPGMGM